MCANKHFQAAAVLHDPPASGPAVPPSAGLPREASPRSGVLPDSLYRGVVRDPQPILHHEPLPVPLPACGGKEESHDSGQWWEQGLDLLVVRLPRLPSPRSGTEGSDIGLE